MQIAHVLFAGAVATATALTTPVLAKSSDAQKGEEKQILFLHEQSEFLQIEHVITSKDSIWNDRVKSGQFFVKFLDNAIQAQLKAEQGNQQAAQPS